MTRSSDRLRGSPPLASRRRPAAALSAALLLAVAPTAAQVAPEAPAASPEPVRESRIDVFGERYELILYRLPAGSVALRPSIAERHWLAHRLGDVTAPTDFALECVVNRFGLTERSCESTDNPATSAHRFAALKLAEAAIRSVPRFPEVDDELNLRRIAFTVRYDPANAPQLDLESGALAMGNDLAELAHWRVDYPIRAQSAGIEASVTAECQVQTDLSVICRTLRVDSSRPDLFTGLIERERPRMMAPATLADGRSSVGMRKQFLVSFRMAD